MECANCARLRTPAGVLVETMTCDGIEDSTIPSIRNSWLFVVKSVVGCIIERSIKANDPLAFKETKIRERNKR